MILNSEDHLRWITIEDRTIHPRVVGNVEENKGDEEIEAMKEFMQKIDVGNISFISTDLTHALDNNAESYDIKLYGRLTKVGLFDK